MRAHGGCAIFICIALIGCSDQIRNEKREFIKKTPNAAESKIFPRSVTRYDEITFTPKSLDLSCELDGHDICASEYVFIKNRASLPVHVTKFCITGNGTIDGAFEDNSGKAFSAVTNGQKLPLKIDPGDSALIAVVLHHKKKLCHGILVIATDSELLPQIHVPLSGHFNLEKLNSLHLSSR